MILDIATLSALAVASSRRRSAPPFVVGSNCQSDIKRTLRRSRTPTSDAVCDPEPTAFDTNGERMVSNRAAIWFRIGGRETFASRESVFRQSNIYVESRRSDFLRISLEL
jgi:hypothetical protein